MFGRTALPGWLVASLVMIVLVLPGCSDRSKATRKYDTIKGIAKDIDVEKRLVSMLWENDKGQQIPLDGSFTDETDVIINGRNQSIRDIRPGDAVQVTGYRERKGDNVKLVATKVVIERQDDWKPTGKQSAAASEEATGAPQPDE